MVVVEKAIDLIGLRKEEPKQAVIAAIPPDDLIAWAERHFYIPETKEPIVLEPHQRATLRAMFAPLNGEGGRRVCPWSTVIYSAPKKSGKTAVAALVTRWLAEEHMGSGQLFCTGNDADQAKERAFRMVKLSIELTPGYLRGNPGLLKERWQVQEKKMTCLQSGAEIKAIAVDYRGEAGANPGLTVWTELWGYDHKDSQRFYNEMTPVPTLPISVRLVETYAGFSGESELLESLYELAKTEGRQLTAGELAQVSGEPIGVFSEAQSPEDLVPIWVNETASLIMYWDNERRLPWQNGPHAESYYREQEATLPPAAYERFHRNKWSEAESAFVPMEWWDACYDPELPPLDAKTNIIIAADAATTGDCFAIVAVSRHPLDKLVVAVRAVQIWKPEPGRPIDFDECEMFLKGIIGRCTVEQLAYDAHQLFDMMQRFRRDQVCWVKEFPQGKDRVEADRQLYDLIRQRQIRHNGDPNLREHIQNANQKLQKDEDSKMRIVKKRSGKKIDAAVALSMAANRCLYLDL